jgi:hypothetical protein
MIVKKQFHGDKYNSNYFKITKLMVMIGNLLVNSRKIGIEEYFQLAILHHKCICNSIIGKQHKELPQSVEYCLNLAKKLLKD